MVVTVPVVLIATSSFGRSKYRQSLAVLQQKQLEQFNRALMNQLVMKLKASRWYGQSSSSTSITTSLGVEGVSITAYIDDLVASESRWFHRPEAADYKMLDSILITIQGAYLNERLTMQSRLIFSPEPVFEGSEVLGIDYDQFDQKLGLTLQKVIHQRTYTVGDLKVILGEKNLAIRENRYQLYLNDWESQIAYMSNYYNNIAKSEAFGWLFSGFRSVFSKNQMRNLISSMAIEKEVNNKSFFRNFYIKNHFMKFVMQSDWVGTEQVINELKEDFLIEHQPIEHTLDQQHLEILLSESFEERPETSKRRNHDKSQTWYYSSDQNPQFHFWFDKKGDSLMQKPSTDLISELSHNEGLTEYTLKWTANCLVKTNSGTLEDIVSIYRDYNSFRKRFDQTNCNKSPSFSIKAVNKMVHRPSHYYMTSKTGDRLTIESVLRFFSKIVSPPGMLAPKRKTKTNCRIEWSEGSTQFREGVFKFIY